MQYNSMVVFCSFCGVSSVKLRLVKLLSGCKNLKFLLYTIRSTIRVTPPHVPWQCPPTSHAITRRVIQTTLDLIHQRLWVCGESIILHYSKIGSILICFCGSIINLIRVAYVVRLRRPCSDFTDMLRHLISCRIIIVIKLLLLKREKMQVRPPGQSWEHLAELKC